jgi:mono/diheme cytochrome c family protein
MGVPNAARDLTNPVPASAEALSEAMEHFADHCAFCHANDGSGQSDIGRGLYPKPPDMRLPETQNLTDGELYYVIENGVRLTGMPAFGREGNAGNDEATWKLVRFIRHLPDMTDDEFLRMKDLRPKSPAELKEEEEFQKFLSGESDNGPTGEEPKHQHKQ